MSEPEEPPPPEKPAAPLPEVPSCPVCGEPFVRSTLVLCRDCSAPHHRRCWSFNKGCSTYACTCRAFVLPPVKAGDEVEFSVLGNFGLGTHLGWAGLFTAFSMALTGIAAAAFGWSEQLIGIATAIYFSTVWVVPVALVLTRQYYVLDAEDRTIRRLLRMGGMVLSEDPDWKSFSDIEELEVRTGRGHGNQGVEVRLVEVWARTQSGDRYLLESTLWQGREEVLERADAAADLLDTTLSLPRALSGGQALPAGLDRAIAALPAGTGSDED